MPRDIASVKRRVRSLLEVAKPTSGATDAERATAKSLADKLMAAHGLTEADIPQRRLDSTPPPPPPAPSTVNIYVNGFNFGFTFHATDNTSGFWTEF